MLYLDTFVVSTSREDCLRDMRRMLEEAGYRVVNGRLHYPAGRQETLQPMQ